MAQGKVAMTEQEQMRLAERRRRIHRAVVVTILAMPFVVLLLYYTVLRSLYPDVPSSPAGHVRVEVPRSQWARFAHAADRFATANGFVSLEHEIGMPVMKDTVMVRLGYRRDGGTWMDIEAPAGKEEFIFRFTDRAGLANGARLPLTSRRRSS